MVQIKFCGGCNPEFSLKRLASKVKQEFPDSAGARGNILLLLNGCKAGCLKPKDFVGENANKHEKILRVAGTSVDGQEASECDLGEMVVDAVRAALV